ncbi:MAG: hypothetical protein M3Q39_04890 [Actinomycetota bacterium]|nr:hypothetical protein [Actinomycetota bacterium]
MPRLSVLDDHSLQDLCLGPGTYLLVESPYSASPFLEDLLFDLQTRGFRPLLAHPERCPIFHRDRTLLERLVAQGVLCSITAASLVGGFGRTVRRFTQDILSAGLVHDIASDAHDTARRPPGLTAGLDALRSDLPELAGLTDWYAHGVPGAVIRGEPVPRRPPVQLHRPSRRWSVRRRA